MLYEGLRAAAAKKGWTIEGDSALREALLTMPITITGTEQDVPVQLVRASALHTLATNAFIKPAIAWPFDISTEGMTGAIAHALGIEDVEIGDEAFDREFRLVSKDPQSLKKLLTPEVRAVVQELAAETKSFARISASRSPWSGSSARAGNDRRRGGASRHSAVRSCGEDDPSRSEGRSVDLTISCRRGWPGSRSGRSSR